MVPFTGPLCEAPDSWGSALAALRAVTPAADDVDVRQALLTSASAGQSHAIAAAAIDELARMLSEGQPTPSQPAHDMQQSLTAQLSTLLLGKTQHPSPDIRTASLRCLRIVASAPQSAEQVAAVALAAQSRLTDVDLGAADAAAELLAAVAVPAALLAATGVNVGGMQDEPPWRSQVCRRQTPCTMNSQVSH